MNPLLARGSLRFFLRHPLQLLLALVSIILGVGIVTAVLVTNASSTRAFALSVQAISGNATHEVVSASGWIADSVYRDLRLGVAVPMAPFTRHYLQLNGDTYTVLGVDPFADLRPPGFPQPARDSADGSNSALLDSPWLRDPDAFIASFRTLRVRSLDTGRHYPVQLGQHQGRLLLAAGFDSNNSAATENLLLADLDTVQRLFGTEFAVQSISLQLDDASAARVTAMLPTGLELRPAQARNQSMQDMTRGFQINLTAMSLLALLVGAFLIHNTMTFSVLQRREVFATQRVIGVPRRGIFTQLLLEATLIGLAGSCVGVALGYWIAGFLIRLTTRTVNDLYFVMHVQELWFSPLQFALIIGLGVLTSVMAALAAATEAAGISPLHARQRSAVERRTQFWLPVLAGAGILVAGAGFALTQWPSSSLWLAFLAMMLAIIGYAMVVPWMVWAGAWVLRRAAALLGPLSAMAIDAIHRNISRTGMAVSALTVAVATTLGVGIMIGSFRDSVDQWLLGTLQSDIYITTPGITSTGAGAALDPALANRLLEHPDIFDASTSRLQQVSIRHNGRTTSAIDMRVFAPHARSASGYTWLDTTTQDPWQLFTEAGALLISEPLAKRLGKQAGDRLELHTPGADWQPFTIAAVYRDYGSSHGRISMLEATHERYWPALPASSLGLLLNPDSVVADVATALRQLTRSAGQSVQITSNREIHRESLEVFDRTFLVTRVLRLLTLGVAFVGVFSALLALHLERAREYAVLRATGVSRPGVAWLVTVQTLTMGLLAGLLAIPLGLLLADMLINVINVRSFGWTMKSLVPPDAVLTSVLLALLASALAGLYPAWRLGQATIARQLREE